MSLSEAIFWFVVVPATAVCLLALGSILIRTFA